MPNIAINRQRRTSGNKVKVTERETERHDKLLGASSQSHKPPVRQKCISFQKMYNQETSNRTKGTRYSTSKGRKGNNRKALSASAETPQESEPNELRKHRRKLQGQFIA
jgi:hypothetical protein